MDIASIVEKLFKSTLSDFEFQLLESSVKIFYINLEISLIKRLKTKAWSEILFPLISSKVEQLKSIESLDDMISLCWEFRFVLFFVLILGNDANSFLEKSKKTREDIEANSFVSIFSTLPSTDLDILKSYLLKWVSSDDEDLQFLVNYWDEIPCELRSKSPSKIRKGFTIPMFTGFSSKELACEAVKWLVPDNVYQQVEQRWLRSLEATNCFEEFQRQLFVSNCEKYTGAFLKKDDPRGIFLGNYTNCCQHISGTGSNTAWYGQEKDNSTFFIITDQNEEIIAMSWVWTKNGAVIFDSIESKGIGGRSIAVVEIYQKAGSVLSSKFDLVQIGARGAIDLSFLPDANPINLPEDFKLVFEDWWDSKEQKLLI